MELVSDSQAVLDSKYSQISVEFNKKHGVLWSQLNQDEIPCFTMKLLKEAQHHQDAIENSGGQIWVNGEMHQIRYSVNSSLKPGIFSLGGQLSLFRDLIRAKNRDGLMLYGTECINMMFPRLNHYYLPITTIALVQGSALGGGFEGALANDVIIAEKGSQMGFPEILFNLFPGMGAYNLLSRKVGTAIAEKLILSGKIYAAEELHEMGVVDVLAEPGFGVQAVYEFVARHERHGNGYRAVRQVSQACNQVTYEELMQVIRIWVDAALRLEERDLKIMDRFVRQQEKTFLSSEGRSREYLIA
ncbi:MAG: crotonase/enoyl-CoA hydratase family protein [Betaproteobacteria bacterium]|nr:crotonase/enoyl-CoA hydratase family protein [Betaproteobacteria bacterium]